MGKQKKGIAKYIEISMKCTTIIVSLAEVVSIVFDITSFPFWVRLMGVIIGFGGTAVFICAVITMRDSWRAGVSETDKTELITGGIYQFSRNPAFLRFDLVYIGMVMMFFSWWLLVASVLAILTFHLQIINVEEEFLNRTFGEEYVKYKRTVCRYFGRKLSR